MQIAEFPSELIETIILTLNFGPSIVAFSLTAKRFYNMVHRQDIYDSYCARAVFFDLRPKIRQHYLCEIEGTCCPPCSPNPPYLPWLPSEAQFILMCQKMSALCEPLPNVLHLRGPVHVLGNLQGHIADLIEITKVIGEPPLVNYVILGSFVNRGGNSLEVLCYLFSWKILYPNHVHILRGNQESSRLCQVYGLFDSCWKLYPPQDKNTVSPVWWWLMDVFNNLPLAAIVNGDYFLCHSGLSKGLVDDLTGLHTLERRQDIPEEGIVADMMYTVPQEYPGWNYTNCRSSTWHFGPDVTAEFLKNNRFKYVLRSHTYSDDGYQIEHDGKLITVFSAANFMERCGNKGGVVVIDEESNYSIQTYEQCRAVRDRQARSPLSWLFFVASSADLDACRSQRRPPIPKLASAPSSHVSLPPSKGSDESAFWWNEALRRHDSSEIRPF